MDITERKQAEEALIRSEKLISIGRMAATIAHEINNPLAAVMNSLFLARTNMGDAVSVREYLDVADAELTRIAHIARQVLGFYRESTTSVGFSVDPLLDSAFDLLKNKISAKGAIVSKECEQQLCAYGVPGELRQVIVNLLLNSLEALSPKGTIRLRASTASSRDGGPRVRITLVDNGTGISRAALDHLFEPFFTTKRDTGNGLGLWVSKQIVDKHGGSIRVRSCTKGPHKGTAFSLLLPAEPGSPPPKSKRMRQHRAKSVNVAPLDRKAGMQDETCRHLPGPASKCA